MAALAEAFVRIRPDTSTFRQETEKGVEKAAPAVRKIGDRHGKLFGTAFVKSTAGPLRGIAGVIGKPVAAAFAVIGGAKLFGSFIAEGREAQKVGAQTAAVIKSTGGAAKISSKQVGDLATAISNKVGVDDEAIQSGANLLLTFTGIRNEAGKGNRIFDQATTAVVDMTAAMNGGKVTQEGMKAASIQVGKALNDPIKGMTALRKVGVSFTDQQVEQVKAMVKSGNTLGAQKLILRELNKEFGGSAAAGTNAMQKLGVVFGNIKEQVGTALLPVIDRVAAWLGARLPAAVAKASLGLRALTAAFREGDITSDGFVGVMERIGVSARRTFDYFKAEVLPRLRDFGGFLKDVVLPQVAHFADFLVRNRETLIPLIAALGTIVAGIKAYILVTKIAAAVQLAWNAAALANPIGVIIILIAALVVGVITAYKTSSRFREIVQATWRGIQAAASVAWAVLKGIFAAIVAAFTWVGRTATSLWQNVLRPVFKFIVGAWLTVAGAIINGAARAFGWVPGIGPKLKTAAAEFNKFAALCN